MITDDNIKKEMKKSINKLYTSLNISHYDQLYAYNDFIIKDIKDIIIGTFITILSNEYYYNILGSMHKGSINLSKGRIDISNFNLLIGTDEDKEEIEELVYVFEANFYHKDLIIFTCDIRVLYAVDVEMTKIFINSDTLDDLNAKKFDNIKVKDYDEASSIMKNVIEQNKSLDTISFALDNLLDIEEIKNILNRYVFIIDNKGGE
jgi:hypothetical protein